MSMQTYSPTFNPSGFTSYYDSANNTRLDADTYQDHSGFLPHLMQAFYEKNDSYPHPQQSVCIPSYTGLVQAAPAMHSTVHGASHHQMFSHPAFTPYVFTVPQPIPAQPFESYAIPVSSAMPTINPAPTLTAPAYIHSNVHGPISALPGPRIYHLGDPAVPLAVPSPAVYLQPPLPIRPMNDRQTPELTGLFRPIITEPLVDGSSVVSSGSMMSYASGSSSSSWSEHSVATPVFAPLTAFPHPAVTATQALTAPGENAIDSSRGTMKPSSTYSKDKPADASVGAYKFNRARYIKPAFQAYSGYPTDHASSAVVNSLSITAPTGLPEKADRIVVYWMLRELRTKHNYSLHYSEELAKMRGAKLVVLFTPCHNPYPNRRQYQWRVEGMKDVQKVLTERDIPLISETTEDWSVFERLNAAYDIDHLVMDFFPLTSIEPLRASLFKHLPLECPVVEVDSHNTVPAWVASTECAWFESNKFRHSHRRKRTKFRYDASLPPTAPARQKKLNVETVLKDFPEAVLDSPEAVMNLLNLNTSKLRDDDDVFAASPLHAEGRLVPGQEQAELTAARYLENDLKGYCKGDDLKGRTSELSPYLNHGFISAQFVMVLVQRTDAKRVDKDRYLNQILTWKELSDNVCLFNGEHMSTDMLPTHLITPVLEEQKRLPPLRLTYTCAEIERARTHDRIWNCCTKQLIMTGLLPDIFRCYWGRMFAYWTKNLDEALSYATTIHDKWGLDATDPINYVSLELSVLGLKKPKKGSLTPAGMVLEIENLCDLKKWFSAVEHSWEELGVEGKVQLFTNL